MHGMKLQVKPYFLDSQGYPPRNPQIPRSLLFIHRSHTDLYTAPGGHVLFPHVHPSLGGQTQLRAALDRGTLADMTGRTFARIIKIP